jgi:radical SAM superfamily enzyme YgiQ (UPF0313 family)
MNILLVYPEHPETFWNFKYALKFVFKKTTNPPLGLLTVAALLPREWKKKLVDMNVSPLKQKDLEWADMVFISAASIQQVSAREVIARCREAGVKCVAGGPLFTIRHQEFKEVDYFILNEAEITLPAFLEDLKQGRPQRIYTSEPGQWADLSHSPVPLRELVTTRHYAAMNIQYSRGCPFQCEFCGITMLYGRLPRTKTEEQILAELDDIYALGWRGSIFFVDDNFIGNKQHLKKSVLPAMIAWMERKKYPFTFFTQASVNLADDRGLMAQMTQAGFDMVFIGIETPHETSLEECAKAQNKNRNLITSVHTLHQAGLQVLGGFIVGFDHDPPDIFERQIYFIQKSGVVGAIVGLLNAIEGTPLHQRMDMESRLKNFESGDSTDFSINFEPKMGEAALMAGYRQIIAKIYSPNFYNKRIVNFLNKYQRPVRKGRNSNLQPRSLVAFLLSIIRLGLLDPDRKYYWKLLHWTLIHHPESLGEAVTLVIYGYHYRKVFENYLKKQQTKESHQPACEPTSQAG